MSAIRNRVQLIGHVGHDPEIKNYERGKRASLSLATTETYRNDKGDKVEETQWHKVAAWGKTADLIEQYVTKGKEIIIGGRIVHRSYEDKNGDKKYITEIIADEVLFFGK